MSCQCVTFRFSLASYTHKRGHEPGYEARSPSVTSLVYIQNFICTCCLYLHAGSPNVTNLTVNNQSRTFTCTSTGGPAATVTWRRDWVVITLNATHQQTKRIIDNSTSTYQTVLTIDLSVSQSDIPGIYSCTVENARGRSSRAVVIPGNGELHPYMHTLLGQWWYINYYSQLILESDSLSQYLSGFHVNWAMVVYYICTLLSWWDAFLNMQQHDQK